MTNQELMQLPHSEMIKLIDEGKLVYLPCKVGDTVYEIAGGGISFPEISQIIINDDDDIYFEWQTLNIIWDVAEFGEGEFKLTDIGKTVFLTREEAEKALKENKNNSLKY